MQIFAEANHLSLHKYNLLLKLEQLKSSSLRLYATSGPPINNIKEGSASRTGHFHLNCTSSAD